MTRPTPPRIHLGLTPDRTAQATAEAIDHADAQVRAAAGRRACEALNRDGNTSWWLWPCIVSAALLIATCLWMWLL